MPGLSSWAVRRPVFALIAWLVAVIAIFGVGSTFAGTLNDSFDLPNTESKTATDLLASSGANTGSYEAGATIVWSPTTGSAVDPAVLAEITPTLQKIADLSAVACVALPTGQGLGTACPPAPQPMPEAEMAKLTPEQQAALKASMTPQGISPDGRVAIATVTFSSADPTAVPTAAAKEIIADVKAANTDTLRVGANGQVLDFAGQEPPSSELIGIIAALIILLVAFGSVVAAGLPIVVAGLGVALGVTLVTLLARFMDVATFAPTLAAMIGLGVGIDYGLFVLNRFRSAILLGRDKKAAALEAVNTAGRAVLFAGSTVIIALLGLFVLGINFFNGLALAAGLTVLMVMLSALWFLPALLSLLGTKTLAIRLPWGKKPGSGHVDGHRWAAYGAFLQRRPWLWAVLSLAFVIILAIPVLSLRQGFSDDSGKPVGSIARTAYDLRAEGFGPGSNGPFLVVAQLPSAGDTEAYKTIVTELAAAPGVAGTNPSVAMLPLVDVFPQEFGLTGDVAVIGVIPSSAPQDQATTDLLNELRETVDPKIEADTGAKLYVGGTQAITSDFTTVLKDALPIFLLVVIGLGFLALVLLFRSIIVPATAAVTSLLSFAASMGITVAVFQWGWFNSLLGISGTGPIMPFLPIMVFAILFGLSMDYQVFLVSRMREEWERTDDNRAAIRRGLAGSGRVVVIAALIMASVFMAFIPTPDSTIKLFGISLASAVLIDAFIIRLIFVPSLMTIIGRPNWWLPRWLGKILPVVHVESESEDDEVDDVLPVKAGQ